LTDKSGKHGLDDLRTFQDFTLRYALGSVPGVAEVASVGGYQKQYQVTVDPNRLRAYGVTLSEVIEAIRQSNNDVGGRILEFSGREYYVRGRGYIKDLGSIEKIAIRASGTGGTPLLIKDLATVRFGPDIRRGLLEWNGEGEAVGGIVVMRYGENALDVIERVKKKFADLQPSFPEGVEMTIAYDRSGLIERSIYTLKHALTEEAIVVSLVIMLFLLHFRSSLLPILSLPISVALSFIPMVLLDIPSTIMSLGGIAIAIGATVDAQIVMIEAGHKKLEHAGPGADRHRLLIEAAKEVTPAIFFSLLIIAVAFLPVFTLTGQAGRLFKPLAYTKTFVMLISALLSITFAPALQDLFIRGKIRPEKKHPVSRFLIRVYEPFVYVALRRPKSTVAIGLFALASAVPLAMHLGNEFMPPLNEGDLLYMPITFPNISIEEAKRQLQYQDRMLRGFPEVATVFGKVGRAESATDPAPITMVETTVQLRPASQWRKKHHDRWYSGWAPHWLKPVFRPFWPEERPLSWEELTTEMNGKMQFPGWTNAWTMPIKTRVDMLTTGVRTPIGIKVFGTDLNEVERVGIALEESRRPVPRHHSQTGRARPLRLAHRRRRARHRERHRRHPHRDHDRGAQSLLHQRPLSAGSAEQHGLAPQRAHSDWRQWRRRGADGDAGGAGTANREVGVRLCGSGRVSASRLPCREHGRHGERAVIGRGPGCGHGAAAPAIGREHDVGRSRHGTDGAHGKRRAR
jgi:Cu(I)/Ag(I) efflux system membrane protein CusA/SilA